jgi:hypothetical protein
MDVINGWIDGFNELIGPSLANLEDISVGVVGFGAFLLLVGLVGGGFRIKSISVQRIGTFPRILCGVFGIGFIAIFVAIPRTGDLFDLSGKIAFQSQPAPED